MWANSLLLESDYVFNLINQVFISVFSMGVSYDLIKSVRNPIDSYHQRLKRIFQIGVLLCLILQGVIWYFAYGFPLTVQFYTVDLIIFVVRPLLLLINFTESYVGILSIYTVFRGIYLRKGPNHSREVKYVIRRQICMVLIRFCTQLPGNFLVLQQLRSQIIMKV
jgi:hypothetical protein